MTNAAIGFRAKTGRAIAVVITRQAGAPSFVWRGEISLVDPEVQTTHGPYHEVMELPWSDAQVAVKKLVTLIESAAAKAVRNVIAEMRSTGVEIKAAVVVGSAQKSLDRIGNFHIRAHAAEGILFRRVLELAAEKNHLTCAAFAERELSGELTSLAAMMKTLGRAAGPPWRMDERLAATAAWIALR
jgi:hypothetical protein